MWCLLGGLLLLAPRGTLAQPARAQGEIATYAEVLSPPAVVSTAATPLRFEAVARNASWESQVRVVSEHRFALEVDGRRIAERDARPILEVIARQDGSVERRFASTAVDTGPTRVRTRELTVRFRASPGTTQGSAAVRVMILVGYDGAT